MSQNAFKQTSIVNADPTEDRCSVSHPVDQVVGRRIRMRRQQLRISQTALGAGVGISFQQIQKYERGANRVSSSVLYEIAAVLDVPMTFFFETLPKPQCGRALDLERKAEVREEFVATEEGQRLVDAFLNIPAKMRPKFIAILATFNALEP